jgi:DNA-binding protein YbaB
MKFIVTTLLSLSGLLWTEGTAQDALQQRPRKALPNLPIKQQKSESERHFQQSMKYAEGEGLRAENVKGEIEPVASVVKSMEHFLKVMPEESKKFSKARTTMSIFAESFHKFIKNVHYTPGNPGPGEEAGEKLTWDQAAWQNLIRPLKANAVSLLKTTMDSCEELLQQKIKSQKDIKRIFFKKKILSPEDKKEMEDTIAAMSLLIITFKNNDAMNPKANITKEHLAIFAQYYGKFEKVFNNFMEVYQRTK